MKLTKLQTTQPIPDGTPGGKTAHFTEANGFEMEFAQGLVTVTRGDWTLLVPVANVACMVPVPAPVKPLKAA